MMKSNSDSYRILVLNCGSSSLKYRIYEMPAEQELVDGEVQRLGIKTASGSELIQTFRGKTSSVSCELADHKAALRMVLAHLKKTDVSLTFDCIAHRYVHPGNIFTANVLVDEKTIVKLKKTLQLAPIHNPVAYSLVEDCLMNYHNIPQYLIFDTTFHTTIPPEIGTYAIPRTLSKKYGIRKIGFHGLSHRYVMEEACHHLGVNPGTMRIISCHLGTGGASVCAIQYGKSLASSMGFTPLEGLIMNTRCGDLDIGLLMYIMHIKNFSEEEISKVLNKQSGILGMFKATSDLRDIIPQVADNKEAATIFRIYINRIRKYLGYYALLLKKADLLIFTDTLGVEEPLIREKICEGFGFLGITLDTTKNNQAERPLAEVSGPSSETKILVMSTNEELMIARETYLCITSGCRQA